jgi:hypothetical protein
MIIIIVTDVETSNLNNFLFTSESTHSLLCDAYQGVWCNYSLPIWRKMELYFDSLILLMAWCLSSEAQEQIFLFFFYQYDHLRFSGKSHSRSSERERPSPVKSSSGDWDLKTKRQYTLKLSSILSHYVSNSYREVNLCVLCIRHSPVLQFYCIFSCNTVISCAEMPSVIYTFE